MKKTLIILSVVIFIALVALLGWYFVLRDTTSTGGNPIRDILPFGSGDSLGSPDGSSNTLNPDGTTPGETFNPLGESGEGLSRLSETPVAGAVIFVKNNKTTVRYADRATGHIYDVILSAETSSNTIEKIKVTNNTLPKIYEAYFRPDGNAVLFRSLENDSDTNVNLTLTLTPSATTSATSSSESGLYKVSTTVMPDLDNVALGSGNSLFYTLESPSSVVFSTITGTGQKTLLNLPFTSWRISPATNNLFLSTKASAGVAGYTYRLPNTGGALTKVLGPLNGLIATPNSAGNRILYSYIDSGRTKLFAKNLQNDTEYEILPATFSEKCVWSIKNIEAVFCATPRSNPGGAEPDNWYLGSTHFSDSLWMFDSKVGIAKVLLEPEQSLGVSVDAVDLKLSPNEDYLIFTNKTDLSLWALRLEAI